MPVLRNAKHEHFACLLAEGKTASEAYVEVGYAPSRGNASHLANKPHIIDRVQQIISRNAAAAARIGEITTEKLIGYCEEIRQMAYEKGQFNAAVSAVKEIGVLSGKRIERTEQGEPGEFAAMEAVEIYETLRQEARELGIELEPSSPTEH